MIAGCSCRPPALLTAGRRDATQALFPYVTDDRLHAAAGKAGPVTRLRVTVDGDEVLWIPFGDRPEPRTRRILSKSVVGDSVSFEEQRHDLGLSFAYRWSSSAEFGFVRTVTVRNGGRHSVRIRALDGLVDVLPYGLEPPLYQRLSNLTNAYKRSELVDEAARLALYTLETPVSDQADPEEVLRATVVWSIGLDGPVALDAAAIARFEAGDEATSPLVTGRPGAYLAHGTFELAPGEATTWHVVADVAQDQSDVVGLRRTLLTSVDLATRLRRDTRRTAERLVEIMASADAVQLTGDDVACAHHFANVTYNVMRGGVPLDGYLIHVADFAGFVAQRNRDVAARHTDWFASLPDRLDRRDLLDRIVAVVADTDDMHLLRLGEEYLPFSFSRRHGDPSRPWNQFSIRLVDDAGRPLVYFEGNWRDLFQNWEALCASYPEYLPGVVSVFVNASTADGHNPYRITRGGIDWEVPDPDDPWGNIGYWGDHQIVYLLRLLEATERFLPGELPRRLQVRAHTYADVPYRIASYDDLLHDPRNTIEFDADADARANERVDEIGGDGRLLVDRNGSIVLVTLTEKLVVSALAKLSNFVPGGGIWMNTQRPEWNDANNALVGNGLSMVTLFHLRRYLDHLRSLVAEHGRDTPMSAEVVAWFEAVAEILHRHDPAGGIDEPERERRSIMDRLGRAASDHRAALYESGISGELAVVEPAAIVDLCDVAIGHLDETIRTSWRDDGLVHSYNILQCPTTDSATVSHLPEMLEGQVAALSSGVVTAGRQADLLDALFESALVRHDLGTFLLAPTRQLPSFLDKNVIDPSDVAGNPLLAALEAADERSMIRTDPDGTCRFAPELTTESALVARLEALGETERWATLVEGHGAAVLDVYESVFHHRSYLGRSGSMYAFEGIGSIYWHMVTKLLLAVQEAVADAAAQRRAAARCRTAPAGLLEREGRARREHERRGVRCDSHRPLLAHAGARRCPAARDDRCREGGDPGTHP